MSDTPPTQPGLGRSAFELKRMVEGAPGVCPVCRFVDDGIQKHIDYLFYESVNDIATRERVRQTGGFCRHHARLVARHADALGTTLIMKDMVTNDVRAIDAGTYDSPASGGSRFRLFESASRLPERAQCPLCEAEEDIEVLGADSFLEALGDGEFMDFFNRSAGLCVPHFRLAFERCRDNDRWQPVLDRERQVLQELVEVLDELARTYDYRFREDAAAADTGSWRRALNITSREVDS